MFIRTKTIQGKEYYYLVESYRLGGKVKQRVIKYIGRGKPSPQDLENIIRGLEK